MSVSVCLSAGLCMCAHRYSSGSTHPNYTIFDVHMLPVAVAWPFSGSVALCCVLPVLWMTTRFHVINPVASLLGLTSLLHGINCVLS